MSRSESARRGPLAPILVVVPTYNEADNLERILGRLRASVPHADVLVVDDSSPDGTGDIADKLAERDTGLWVLHRIRKQGIGAAYVAGFRWGLERGYQTFVEMDADGSHQPEQLGLLLDALGNADVALGARWIPGGRVVNWSPARRLLSRGGNAYVRIMLGVDLRDATGGFRAFRRSTLEQLDLDDVASQGYCFQVDLAWRAVERGLVAVEVPITFIEREHGESKMSRAIVGEALRRVTLWGVRHRSERVRARLSPNSRD